MKRILTALLLLFCIPGAAYLIYLNEAVLPQKLKAALIEGLEKSTGKEVEIASAKLDLFRGLVIKELCISDKNSAIVYAKDIRCRFLAIPVLRKEIVVTSIRLDSPKILVERLPDNSINIVELFFKKPITLLNGRYGLTISRILVAHGELTFKDKTFQGPEVKELNKVNIDVKFLPYRIGFDSDFEIASRVPMYVKASGEYKLLKKELSMRIEAKDFYPRDFIKYCDEKRFNIPDGRIDLTAALDYKDNILNADAQLSGIDMKFSTGKVDAALSGAVKAKLKYDFSSKELIYTGTAAVKNLALYNLGPAEKIYDIRGSVSFSDKSFVFNDMTATVFGVPVKAYTAVKDLQKPVLNIDVVSDVRLSVLKNVLKNKFNLDIPFDMAGEGSLKLYMQLEDLTGLPAGEAGKDMVLQGTLDVSKAVFRPEYGNAPFEDVAGRFEFTQNQLVFKKLKFKYKKAAYTASGVVTNFKAPGVQLELSANRLYAKALFSVNDKKLTISSLVGHYDAYGFSIQGELDTADTKNLAADLSGTLAFELSDSKEPYKSFSDKFKGLKPAGDIRADFKLRGNLNDLPHSMIDALVKCDKLTLNGVRLDNATAGFSYRNNVYNIERIFAQVYGGAIEGNGLIDCASKDMSYQVNIDAKNVKIEELREDTPFKDKDISGVIQSKFGVKGFPQDLSRFSAWGKINISKGRLWQLNLFRGIGTLLFKSDFSSVMFEEGSCSFSVKDKTFFTSDLMMKSSLLNIYGALKLTFDKRIKASLRTEFTDEGVDAARSSGIAGAIERYSVIEAKGTFDEPNCKVRPDLTNVVSDIADNFFN